MIDQTTTRSHSEEVLLAATPETVFEALITPSSICEWWHASRAIVIPKEGGIWAAAWGDDEDDPDFLTAFVIEQFEPPHTLALNEPQYYAKTGPLPFECGSMTTQFNVVASGEHALLRVEQHGFPCDPIADDYFAGCQKGWRDTFASIKSFLSATE